MTYFDRYATLRDEVTTHLIHEFNNDCLNGLEEYVDCHTAKGDGDDIETCRLISIDRYGVNVQVPSLGEEKHIEFMMVELSDLCLLADFCSEPTGII